MHLPDSFLTCCLCRDTELSDRVGSTPALLGTDGSAADEQREVVAGALGGRQCVLEEGVQAWRCAGVDSRVARGPADVTSLVRGERGMEMCCLGMWLHYSAGNGSYWWSLSTYTRTLQPTTMSLNFTALPFEELNLRCKILKELQKYTQKYNLVLVKYFAFVFFKITNSIYSTIVTYLP